MALLPGHESCWICPTCHLTNCPDCDSEGRCCPMDHPGENRATTDLRRNRRAVKGRERGAYSVGVALIVLASAGFAAGAVALGSMVGESVAVPLYPIGVR